MESDIAEIAAFLSEEGHLTEVILVNVRTVDDSLGSEAIKQRLENLFNEKLTINGKQKAKCLIL